MSTYCGDDYAEVWNVSTRRAVKDHRCSACGETIRPGDLYTHTFYIYDGDTGRIRRCARCELLYLALCKAHDEEPPEDWGDGVDALLACGHTYQQVFGREPPTALARLAFLTPDEVQRELQDARNRDG